MLYHAVAVVVHRAAGNKELVAACCNVIDGKIISAYRKRKLLPDIAVSLLPIRSCALPAILLLCTGA